MAERKAVTKQMVKRYRRAGKTEKGRILACQTELLKLVKAKRKRPPPKPKRGGKPTENHPWKTSYKRAFEVRQRKTSSRT